MNCHGIAQEIGERISNMPVPADFKLSADNTADVKVMPRTAAVAQ